MNKLKLSWLIISLQLIAVPLCQAGNKSNAKAKGTLTCMDMNRHTYGNCKEDTFLRNSRWHELGDRGGLIGKLLEFLNLYAARRR